MTAPETTTASDAPVVGDAKQDYSARRLGREAVIYGLAMVAGRMASFIMLPVYTRLLTPSDYGILQLLDMTVDVAAILMSAGVTTGVMRFYFKARSDGEREAVLGSAFFLELGLNLVGTLMMVASASLIWRLVLEGRGPIAVVYVAAANFTLAVLGNVPLLKMQMERRALAYSVATLVRVLMQLSLNILFLVGFRWGVIGILVSTLITNVVIGGGMLLWMLRRTRITVSRAAIRDLRRFGVPYQIATAATFVLTFGDRFFLQAYQGLAAVGIYGLAYQFGFLLANVAVKPFMRAWKPQRYQLASETRTFRDEKYNQGLRYFSLITITAAVGITLFVRPVLEMMAEPSFWSAASIVPVIVAAYFVQALSDAVQFGIDVSERTKYVTYAMWISVVVIVILYFALVPRFGAMGAALATLLTFLFRFGLLYYFSQRLWPVHYTWGATLRLTALAVGVTVVAFSLNVGGYWAKGILGVVLLLIYLPLALLTALDPEERRLMLGMVREAPSGFLAKLARS